MKIDRALNIDDLLRLAKRRLPRVIFDLIEGGAEDERCMERNRAAFARHRLMTRYLVNINKRDQSVMLFGHKYSSPFGIAPTGLAALFRPGADLMLAEAAASANIPFVMSGGSTASIEAAAQIAPKHMWYQLYPAREAKISEDLIRRACDAGCNTLVITVDVPVSSKRERDMRNGFGLPKLKLLGLPSLRWPVLVEALVHPAWIAGYLRHGMPRLENWERYAGPATDAATVAVFAMSQTSAPIGWRDLETFRRLWPRHLVIKGILHPDDAVRAAQAGVDGIWVSNHGGRQLDQAPAPLDVFPFIRTAVGDRVTLMLDSGVRRGADVLIALCLGARFVFVGRATLYGAAAGGRRGARKAIDILRDEIDRVMAQIGCPNLEQLNSNYLGDVTSADDRSLSQTATISSEITRF